jgi:glutamate synthase (NADPH/NADH) small chain
MTAHTLPIAPIRLDADLTPPLSPRQAIAESARCLYCFDAACVSACPTGIDIPGFIRRITDGNPIGAGRTILAENILGGTCARVCPTEILCQAACVRSKAGEPPVAIGRLQRFATDALMARLPHPFSRAPDSGKTVAVVGAGPAGLAAAHRLSLLGHRVALFDARPKPGGLNEYGLAAYKMTGDFAQQEVAFILDIGGIALHRGQRLGADITLDGLAAAFDAVFLAIGLSRSASLAIEGVDSPGVVDALSFIEGVRQGQPLAVPGRVVVIGGGNTAVDAAMQALCLGAESVTLAYRRGPAHMGATPWEQQLARSSGVVIAPWLAPQRIIGMTRVEAVRFERTRLADGRLAGTGELVTLAADLVLTAVGQGLGTPDLPGVDIVDGRIAVDDAYQTARSGVFAGGDCIKTGLDLTVQAVEDGKRAAQAIDSFLRR